MRSYYVDFFYIVPPGALVGVLVARSTGKLFAFFFLRAIFPPFNSVEFACDNEKIVHKFWHHALV